MYVARLCNTYTFGRSNISKSRWNNWNFTWKYHYRFPLLCTSSFNSYHLHRYSNVMHKLFGAWSQMLENPQQCPVRRWTLGRWRRSPKKGNSWYHHLFCWQLPARQWPLVIGSPRQEKSGQIWQTWWKKYRHDGTRLQKEFKCVMNPRHKDNLHIFTSSCLHNVTAKFRGCHESKQKKELSVWFVYLMSLTEQIQSTSRWEPYVPSWKDHNACTHSHMGIRQAQLISWRHIPSKAKGVAFLCKQKSKSNFYKRRRRKIQSLVGPVSRC